MRTNPHYAYTDPKGHVCDCGQPAVNWYSGWECARCKRLRHELEHENRRYIEVSQGGDSRHVESLRQLEVKL